MHEVVKIPMPDSVFDELDDAFVGETESAHDFVWTQMRQLCKDAKIGKLNKICTVNIVKNSIPEQEQIKLKGLTLETVQSNPTWIPKNMEADEIKYFEHKVTDKTLEYLKLYCSFALLRHTKYADSLVVDNSEKLEKMKKANVSSDLIADAKESFAKSDTRFREGKPSCLEEILFNAVYPVIHKKITENIEKEFDIENQEMYPKEEKSSK